MKRFPAPPIQPASPTSWADVEPQLERHRHELTAYCYRMLGSPHEAEDAVQETLIRAWRGYAAFEGRSGLRSWLYRIATNVCFDSLKGRKRRALPIDLAPAWSGPADLGARLPDTTWVQPMPDRLIVSPEGDPAELAASRDSIRLAFVAALQHLLPRQRAALILRDVLRWKAAEAAELLGISLTAIDSLLRRARSRLAAGDGGSTEPDDPQQQQLLDRYVDAFARFDIDALVALIHEDATLSMPPHALWLHGRQAIRRWLLDTADHCSHALLVPVAANRSPAFAVYRGPLVGGGYEPFAIHVLDTSAGKISGIHAFLDPSLFPLFGAPVDPTRTMR